MGGVLKAELLKLRKRPGTWVIAGLTLYFALFHYYIVEYIIYRFVLAGIFLPQVPPQTQLRQILPELFLENVMESIQFYGIMMAIILGALVAGNEYAWGTLKTILTQRPSRAAIYAGQALAVAVVIALIIVTTFVTVGVASWLISVVEGEAAAWPPATDIGAAISAAWLILALWAAAGMVLATLFRSSAVAIGIGIGWVELIEGNIINLFSLQFGWIDAMQEWLPWANERTLAAQWGQPGVTEGTPVLLPVSGQQYVWVSVLYLVGAILLGMLVFRRRDVT
jgi:ABC-type transport system involved in multi-copper enzyme maturation permease subunit